MSVMYICDICDVYVVSFVCLGGIEKTNKNVYTGHFAVSHSAKRCFAECHTETSTKNLTKGPTGGSFLECRLVDTRQRGNFFAECIRRHSAKITFLLSVT
jgi:hypothetical protein